MLITGVVVFQKSKPPSLRGYSNVNYKSYSLLLQSRVVIEKSEETAQPKALALSLYLTVM